MKVSSMLVALAMLASSAAILVADDAATDPADAVAVTTEQIDQWIVELGDTRFATRRQATDALVAAGEPAVEPVVAAALSGSAEVAVRCVQILRRLNDGNDEAAIHAAKVGLQTLADSDNSLVNERPWPLSTTHLATPVPLGGPQGVIQTSSAGGHHRGGNMNVRTRVTNGQRTVDRERQRSED